MGKPIPIGVEFYKKIIDGGYYYLDKTLLIRDILDSHASVSLFTRPRRFGKTLALTMLQTFFEDQRDRNGTKISNNHYFDGKNIASCGEGYLGKMGQYPVIIMSLKSTRQPSYEMAYSVLVDSIWEEFDRHAYILRRECLSLAEREKFLRISEKRAEASEYATAIAFLSRCLAKYHGKNAVILIDEYDVPLENAYFKGFYDEMADFIRSLFESALKTNSSLELAVVTGCLRISKESIFTGLNNLKVNSILREECAEYYGFTAGEMRQMLADYGMGNYIEEAQRWYNGYLFGKTEVYNPWSVINYVDEKRCDKEAFPKTYWSNTSSNSIVRELVEQAGLETRQEIEELLAGGIIEKPVHEDITYEDIYESQDNIWNFLFFTGYLKKAGESFREDTLYLQLTIPNTEIKSIYRSTILAWFDKKMQGTDRSSLLRAIEQGDCDTFGSFVSEQMQESISFFDYGESYYHGFLAGMLKGAGRYLVASNRESGNGRPDLLMRAPSVRGKAVIMELKVARDFRQMETKCREALEQAEREHYRAELEKDGYSDIIVYGISFYKKECMVMRQI